MAFLYHLAIQCKALAQYIIEPNRRQQIQLTKQELENLPEIIKRMLSKYKKLVSQELIRLTIIDEDKKKKLETMFDMGIIGLLYQIKPQYFFEIIQNFSMEEIGIICKVIANYYHENKQFEKNSKISKLSYKVYNNYDKYNNYNYEFDEKIINNKKYKI